MRAVAARPAIKVCGVTTIADARLAVELGAELIGLNFFAKSPRAVSAETARAIIAAVGRDRVRWVGVFVNHSAEQITAIDRKLELDLLQFHGDESTADVAPFAARALKAIRVKEDPEAEMNGFLDLGLWGFVLDAWHPELYGGCGATWDYSRAAHAAQGARILIAGGLKPENVAAACAAFPWGLDVCSGVESRPGIKDRTLMAAFFAAAQKSFQALSLSRTN